MNRFLAVWVAAEKEGREASLQINVEMLIHLLVWTVLIGKWRLFCDLSDSRMF